MNRTPMVRSPLPRRRGVALLLVLGVVIMASVLGYAMLSSAAMNKQVSHNAAVSASAEGLAESGVNLAVYYLQHPDRSPAYEPYKTYPLSEAFDRDALFWQGTNGQFVDFGDPSVGQVKVSVSRPDETNRWQYHITAFGRAPGSTLDRRAEATVHVNAEYRFDHATLTNGDVLWPGQSRVEGDSYSNGGNGLRTGASITGRGFRRKSSTSSTSPQGGDWEPPVGAPRVLPKYSELRSYLKYELPAGQINSAKVLDSTTLGSPGLLGIGAFGGRLEPTTDNPAGIYYAPGDLTIYHDTQVNGTLIVRGNLKVLGHAIAIRAKPGFPALIVGQSVDYGLVSLGPTMRVYGVMYVAGRVDTSLLTLFPTLEVDGAMLVRGGTPVFPLLSTAGVRVTHNRELAHVPDFSEIGRTPISIAVLDWEAQ